jgi:HlyD family secretion protein
VLIELPIYSGESLAENSETAMVMGTDGFTMGIAVDELNISSVKIGQEVSFTIDAVEGDYKGTVSAISYNGSTSGSTTAYQITAKLGYITGIYPGMSASAEIVTESSGDGLLVPVNAVRTSGDTNYVYLSPTDAEEGTEYTSSEINVSDLKKVTVTTGMSDGTCQLPPT